MNWYWWRRRLGRDHARAWSRGTDDATARPRVLLESPDGAEAHSAWRLLTRHGFDTMWCPGPSGRHLRDCSLVRTGDCPLVDGADVIVSALDQSDGKCAEVTRLLDRGAADIRNVAPVVVAKPRRAAEELAATLPHCFVVPGPLRAKTLLHSVSGVTRQRPQEAPHNSG